MEISNRIRYYHFMSGVCARQLGDPLCAKCRAFTNSVRAVKESMDAFEKDYSDDLLRAPAELLVLFRDARSTFALLNPPADALGQKKEGNCKMPEGVCFVKLSKKIIDLIEK